MFQQHTHAEPKTKGSLQKGKTVKEKKVRLFTFGQSRHPVCPSPTIYGGPWGSDSET